ncbi:ribonuclease H-like domain-containing protein [Lactifluus volemus]|nr:ribonuclease H-like domain-containing protein [Lactifluus volemus]
MPKAGYYAVRVGKRPGIYTTWEDCREQVDGYPFARYKKLRTVGEAETWMQGGVTQSGLGGQLGVPYSVKQTIRPMNMLPEQSRASNLLQYEGVPAPSLSSTPTIDWSGSKSQPVAGPSRTRRFSQSMTTENVVYTDGACSRNGQAGSTAGIGVWWGPDDARNLSERCPGAQSNNRAELIAIIRALETIPASFVPLVIKSDSQYAIKCTTEWLPGWRHKNFVTSKGTLVKNVELIKYMDALLSMRSRTGQQVRLEHVRGHAGEVGNEGADALAVCGTQLPDVEEPDWEALRVTLERAPAQGTSTGVESVDVSIYADMVLDENDLLAELEAD